MMTAESRRCAILAEGRQEAAAYLSGLCAAARLAQFAEARPGLTAAVLALAGRWLHHQLVDAAENLAAITEGRAPRWDTKSSGPHASRAILELAFAEEAQAGCAGQGRAAA
jgi:hypothetical protein